MSVTGGAGSDGSVVARGEQAPAAPSVGPPVRRRLLGGRAEGAGASGAIHWTPCVCCGVAKTVGVLSSPGPLPPPSAMEAPEVLWQWRGAADGGFIVASPGYLVSLHSHSRRGSTGWRRWCPSPLRALPGRFVAATSNRLILRHRYQAVRKWRHRHQGKDGWSAPKGLLGAETGALPSTRAADGTKSLRGVR